METDALLSLSECLAALDAFYPPLPSWWPIVSGDRPFEVIVGAVLVQQTRWQTVAAAIARLHASDLLAPAAMAQLPAESLAALIFPCAFYRQKATGLRAICQHIIAERAGSAAALLGGDRESLRRALLALPRIGRETADAVMVYGGDHAAFIVDAYARRLFARVGADDAAIDWERAPYDLVQQYVERRIPATADWGRIHALIVETCICYCTASRPACAACPLASGCATGLARLSGTLAV